MDLEQGRRAGWTYSRVVDLEQGCGLRAGLWTYSRVVDLEQCCEPRAGSWT